MDCRKPLILLMGLLAGVGGCTSSFSSVRVNGTTSTRPKDDDITHKASTYVAFGEFRARDAMAPQFAAQKQQLREDARLCYLKALEVDAKYVPAYVAMARLQQSGEDFASAASVYARAVELSPREAALWFEMGMCQARLRDWSASLASLRKALELEPSNRQYGTTVGYTMARAGQVNEAYELLARIHGEAKAHYDLARMLKHTNQPALARQHATAALQVEPGHVEARTLLAQLDGPAPATPASLPATVTNHATEQPGTNGALLKIGGR